MKKNTEYIIPYEGLKQGKHEFSFDITDTFFAGFEAEHTFHDVNIRMDVELMKDSTMLQFNFKHEGTAMVNCDRCLSEISQHVEATNRLIVKFGDDPGDDNDVIVTLPTGEYEIDLALYIYDYICLSFPWRFDCSDVEGRSCDAEMIAKIEALQTKKEVNNEDDPRWDALKKLK